MEGDVGTEAGKGRGHFFVSVGSLVLARGVLALSQLAALPILARYVPIEEFAVMALAGTVVIFASVLSDAGLGRSLIRSRGFDRAEWSSVFWLLVMVGVGLALAIVAVSPAWAWAFAEPDLVPVLCALSVVPLFQALSAVPNAELERDERYREIARVQMATALGSLSLAAALALLGFGIWALVAQQMALAAIRLGGILLLSRFRPALTFSRPLLSGHVRFARDALAVSAIAVVQTQTPVVAIGRILGDAALGLFAMNQRFARLPQFGLAGPMSAVVYVRMAKVQTDRARVFDIYIAATRLLALVLLPPVALISAAGEPIFATLLSPQWAPVASIFAFSMPGVALEAVSVINLACLFRAIGRTDLQVRQMAEGAALRVALVLVAVPFGVKAVALSLTVWALIYVPRGWMIARRCAPVDIRRCIAAVALPAATSAAFAGLHLLLVAQYPVGPLAEIAIAAAGAFGAAGVAALAELGTLRRDIAIFSD